MGWVDHTKLSKIFDDVAYSRPVFPIFKKTFSLQRHVKAAFGIISRFAIEPHILFPEIEKALAEGRMHPMNAAALMCVNSNKHEMSQFDTPDFLNNFLALYSAQTWQECCDIEGIKAGTPDYLHIEHLGENTDKLQLKINSIKNKSLSELDQTQLINKAIKEDHKTKLEKIKSFCWARDLEHATTPNFLEQKISGRRAITLGDTQKVLKCYEPDAAKKLDEQDKLNKQINPDQKPDLTALPKRQYLALLREADERGNLSETQCGIMLMFILHAREKRSKSGESYINHPVAVAKLVGELGQKYLGNSGRVWMAQMAALLHDGGEKTDINMDTDLQGLLPEEVIEAIRCMHKKEGETYFHYLERVANNRLASVIKLCDIYHNSTDMDENPTAKQAFVYPLSANYIEYRLNNPDSRISVAEFVLERQICTKPQFEEIDAIAESGEHKISKDRNGETASKKRPASDFPHLQIALSAVKSIKQILLKDTQENAYPRREENFTLQA